MSDDEARRARAEERRLRITVRKARLGDPDDATALVRGVAGMELAWRLSRAAWSLSGRSLPSYRREELPIRFVPRQR